MEVKNVTIDIPFSPENETLLDDLAEAHLFTLTMYLSHVASGNYRDAHDCLSAANHVASSFMCIEDTPTKEDNAGWIAKYTVNPSDDG